MIAAIEKAGTVIKKMTNKDITLENEINKLRNETSLFQGELDASEGKIRKLASEFERLERENYKINEENIEILTKDPRRDSTKMQITSNSSMKKPEKYQTMRGTETNCMNHFDNIKKTFEHAIKEAYSAVNRILQECPKYL